MEEKYTGTAFQLERFNNAWSYEFWLKTNLCVITLFCCYINAYEHRCVLILTLLAFGRHQEESVTDGGQHIELASNEY